MMEKPISKKSAGRAFQTSLRVAPHVKDRLRAAAETAGRSLSAEMQARLERSVMDEDRNPALRDPYFKLMVAAVEAAEAKTGRSWREDPQTADACRQLIGALLAMLPEKAAIVRVERSASG